MQERERLRQEEELTVGPLLARAKLLRLRKQWDEATAVCTDALRKFPKSPISLYREWGISGPDDYWRRCLPALQEQPKADNDTLARNRRRVPAAADRPGSSASANSRYRRPGYRAFRRSGNSSKPANGHATRFQQFQ